MTPKRHEPEPSGIDPNDRVNILVVDDLQEKLLVFGTMLEELQQNVVFVRSGAEALREVLLREFAVILLDVNMPDIDGFETAALIRRYRRSAHTPIIFITAYADEPQTARGYSLGAVDYIQSPVVPEVLRSKVRVFVELHQLQRRMARQADERVALAESAAALQLAHESTRRSAFLSELSHALSGLIDLRTGMHTVLDLTVPQLAPAATVLLVDERGGVQRAMRRHQVAAGLGEAGHTTELDVGQLDQATLDRLAQVLQPPPAVRALAAPRQPADACALRSGERVLGALLIDGPPTPLGEALLEEVAGRVAVAFTSAQLYQNLQAEIAERRQAEAKLEEANRRKDEFLAMLSHELRNPLAPIRNAIEIIRRFGPQDAKIAWATDITDRQIRQLTRLVDELLDVARISQGKIVLRRAPVDLSALVAQCLETQRSAIAARKQTLTQALPSRPICVNGDGDRLQQVVNNLLNNAIKYTPEGGCLHLALSAEAGQAVLTLRDNGMGIEAELLPRIFDLFEQGQRTLDRTQGGLGVGLTLVQRLVRMHGGRVQAASAGPGQGAEFSVYLPCETVPAADDLPPAGGEPAPIPQGRRIMLVEDNADVAETTAAMLTLSGHTVGIARDGMEALSYAAEFRPEVVLLDIGLPLMDGYEVARRLRQLPHGRQAHLVALTGYGQAADRQRGREAGFDEHLLKPVDPELLAQVIARAPHLGGDQREERGGHRAEGTPDAGGAAGMGSPTPAEGEPPRPPGNLYTLRRR
jgi:signal transduction histidine kinase/CheY-like chemotaxis protein